MSVSSSYTIELNQTGDVLFQQGFDSAINTGGSGQNQLVNLSSGNNTITVPSGAVAVLIEPPASNAVALVIKGVNGDTGIAIHLTNPMLLSLSSVSTFVINAANTVTGLRLIYS